MTDAVTQVQLDLCQSIASVVTHCAALAHNNKLGIHPVEIECRLRIAEATSFYALIDHLAARPSTRAWATDQTDLLFKRRDTATSRAYTERLAYSHVADAEPVPLYVLVKRSMLAGPLIVHGEQCGRIRVQVSRECYRHPIDEWSEADNDALSRAYAASEVWARIKERRSFVLDDIAPAWRIDATRVVEHSEPADETTPRRLAYELELELRAGRLSSTCDAKPLIAQFASLIHALGLR